MKINLFITTYFVFFLTVSMAQDRTIKKIHPFRTTSSVISTPNESIISEKTKEFSIEVFRNGLQYSEDVYLTHYQTHIDRFVFLAVDQTNKVEFKLFSKIELKNKCNAALKLDSIQFSQKKLIL